jgi:hypothetical protein
MARSDGNYFIIRGYMDGMIMGERSFDTQQEAEFYGKRMLEHMQKQYPKAKEIHVDIDSKVNRQSGPKIKTLASRPGQPERFGIAEQVLRDGSVHLDFSAARDYLAKQTVDGLRYIIKDAGDARDAMGAKGRKFNYYSDLVLEARKELKKRGFSRPGAKDMMAKFKIGDRVAYKPHAEKTAGELVEIRKPTSLEGVEMQYGIKQAGGAIMWVSEGMVVKASRPGAKATFKVEDRFYFGKGRKERFADDAKQIADTILKQLGGGRFIAMTGAKNLAFSSSPPGLRMSIGRGAKDAIKYLRVDYDRGSDTYTMIFANKSGGTVKSVSHVYADSLQRVFTSTTGFDTHL